MATNVFLKAKSLTEQNDGLNYINYNAIREDNKEFLTSNLWDFEFTVPPAAVYFPGNELLRARMRSIQPQFPGSLSTIAVNIRQFKIQQAVMSGDTSGSISIDFTDREDQAIKAFIDDWRDKMGSRDTRYAFRKEDTVAEGKLTLYNSSRKPILVYLIHTLQPTEAMGGLNPQMSSDDASNVGDYSLSLGFEHFELVWKNL